MTERLQFSLSCIREGNDNPLQYSCLENPRDRGAWWVALYGVTQSDTTEATWQQQQQHSFSAFRAYNCDQEAMSILFCFFKKAVIVCMHVCAWHCPISPTTSLKLLLISFLFVNLHQSYYSLIWKHWKNDYGYTATISSLSTEQSILPRNTCHGPDIVLGPGGGSSMDQVTVLCLAWP